MVTTESATEIKIGNIYEFNANSALLLYDVFIDGDSGCVLMVVSERTLDDAARNALIASSEKLGYGKSAIAWVRLVEEGATENCPRIGAADLHTIVEALDPIGIVAADAAAASMLSKAYSKSLKVNDSNRVDCRTVVAFSEFSTMLSSDDDKQKAWHALKTLKRGSC